MKTFKLYRITFAHDVTFANGESFHAGESRMIRASSARMAGTQISTNGGSDIASMELIAVDAPMTGKQARTLARESGVSTRHMLAFPAKVLARKVMMTSNLRITSAINSAVTFHVGGAY